ncbi:MAG TPA: 3-oxoadipate enol-lactonase [Acidobacteriaceae bacterium]|jgi:3-oxoadipate enol-lactonase
MAFLDTGNIRVHYQFEPRSGLPVLVFSNSLGTNLSMWDRQESFFQDSFNVLRFDVRGHGQSSVPARPYSVGDAAQDVLALLDHLGIAKASFCGLSLGGMVGQWLAVHAPERFSAFCICNTGAKIGTPETWNQRIAAVTSKGMTAIVPAVLERWYTSRFRAERADVVEATSVMLSRTDPHGYALACAAIRDMDQRASISSIRTPTLVVYGDQDPVTPPEDAHFLLDQIVGSEALCLSAAHLSNIEAAEEFNTGVLHFLQQVHERFNHG